MTGELVAVDLALDTDGLEAIQALYRQAPGLTHHAVRKDLVPFARHYVDKTLRVEPGDPVHPIRWTPSRHPEDRAKPPNTRWGYYSRQKAAYFATNGFGAGIPYTRQHTLVREWHVIGDYEAGFGGITVRNDSRVAIYVYGQWQQLFHALTGWPSAGSQLQILSLELNDRLWLAVQRIGDLIAQGGQAHALQLN